MNTSTTRSRSLFPLDWTLAWLPLGGPSIRVEKYVDGEMFVVRAELPGVDPEKNIQVAVVDRELRIRCERDDEHRPKGQSEFHYGSFYRAVPLPAGACEDAVTATYDRGVLEVHIPLGGPEEPVREIPVEVLDGEVEPATKR